MPFIMNAWYVAAWPREVEAGKILARTICDEPLVMFRDAHGKVSALEDRCCHREMPLSHGWMEEGTLRCGYHGLRFDGAGRCVECPMQEFIPPGATVRTYPVVERHGWLWLWPGDAARADPAMIPAIFARNHHPDWTSVGGTTYVRGNYQLISDNLLDLTHEAYIHRDSLGNQAVVEHPIHVAADEHSVLVRRHIPEHEPAPFWKAMLFRKLGRHVLADRWQEIHFMAPANVVLDVGVAPANSGAFTGDRSGGVEGCNLNAITPETGTSTHYFWAFARKFHRDDEALSAKLVETIANIFEQDRVAIEAVQKVMDRNPGRKVIHLQTDKGQNMARRMVEARVGAERGAPAAA